MVPSDNNNVVILEMNPTYRDYLRSTISQLGYIPISFDKESICLDNLEMLKPHLIISGSLSLEKTFRFINALRIRNNGFRILIISQHRELDNYININGFDGVIVIKPSNEPYEIKRAISNIQNSQLTIKSFQKYPLIVGNSSGIVKIKKIISELGDSKDSILIQGGPGTGKELVARALHHLSNRRNNPFVKVKVADLTREWFGSKEDDLGKVKQYKKGMIEIANTGTIFLDRIEKCPPFFQTKILQILDGNDRIETGFEALSKMDVRIIASARNNLNSFVEKEVFRKDLFYRLNVINIKIPTLKNRIEDIPLLADFFTDKFCSEFGRCHCDMSEKTKETLSRYHWPGNVRELKNVIKNMVLHADKDSMPFKFIDKNRQHEPLNLTEDIQESSDICNISNIKRYLKDLNKISLKDIQKEFIIRTEKKVMKEALVKTNWNRKKAAILLDISYKTLLNKIKAYNLA